MRPTVLLVFGIIGLGLAAMALLLAFGLRREAKTLATQQSYQLHTIKEMLQTLEGVGANTADRLAQLTMERKSFSLIQEALVALQEAGSQTNHLLAELSVETEQLRGVKAALAMLQAEGTETTRCLAELNADRKHLLDEQRAMEQPLTQQLQGVNEQVGARLASLQLATGEREAEVVGQLRRELRQVGVELYRQHLKTAEQLGAVEQQQANLERQLLDPIRRFDRILNGNVQGRGAAGEGVVEEMLRALPPQWIERNVNFRNRQVVEYALRTPLGKLIPIDSKWAAGELLDQLANATGETRVRLIKQIRTQVRSRALEVQKYLNPNRTLGFCIAAVPDGVFEVCRPLQARLARSQIVLVSYSLLVPCYCSMSIT